jgi:hypothetical protein
MLEREAPVIDKRTARERRLEMMRWMLVAILILQAHFAASYLVPLDEKSQGEFGGLLRWVWPWANGDHGPLGVVTTANGFPVVGFWLAMAVAAAFALAALALLGIWVPHGWWPVLAGGGAVLSILLMALFFGPTKLAPIALDLIVLRLVTAMPALEAAA